MMDPPSLSFSSCGSIATTDQNAGGYRRSGSNSEATSKDQTRRWRDVFWLGIFVIHLIGFGFVLGILGLNRFKKKNRLDIDKYTYRFMENEAGLTEDYWPLYAVAGGVGTVLGCSWLLLLGSRATEMMKVSVHILTTYLAVISVLCFWAKQFFWGVAFAIGAALQFLYVISVIDRYGTENLPLDMFSAGFDDVFLLLIGCMKFVGPSSSTLEVWIFERKPMFEAVADLILRVTAFIVFCI